MRPGADASTPGGSRDMSRVLRMILPSGKRAQHVFGLKVLLRSPVRSRSQAHTLSLGREISVVGGDVGIGVVLVLTHLIFEDEGRLRCENAPGGVAARKSSVHTRLEWIIATWPQVNPS